MAAHPIANVGTIHGMDGYDVHPNQNRPAGNACRTPLVRLFWFGLFGIVVTHLLIVCTQSISGARLTSGLI